MRTPHGTSRAQDRPRAGRPRLALTTATALFVLAAACSGDDEAGTTTVPTAGDASTGADGPATTTTAPPALEDRFTLDNGLDVILAPVPEADATAVLLAFDIGEIHDPPLQSGLASLATRVYATAASGLIPARATEDLEAFYPLGWRVETGADHTLVASVVPNEDVDQELGLVAARMLGLSVTDEDIQRERREVLLQIDEVLAANPPVAARTRAEEVIQPNPNGGNRVGIPAQVAALERDTVAERIAALYRPPNATLVLVGGFDPAPTREAIEEYFGRIEPGGEAGEGAPWGEAGFGSVVSATVAAREGAGGGSTAAISFLAPAPTDPSYAAFLVHVTRLRQAAEGTEVTVGYAPLRSPGVVTISTPLAPDEGEEDVVARLRAWTDEQLALPLREEHLEATGEDWGPLLGLGGYPSSMLRNDPYRVALSLARVEHLGLDASALAAAVASVTATDLERSAELTFPPERSAAAIVIVEG